MSAEVEAEGCVTLVTWRRPDVRNAVDASTVSTRHASPPKGCRYGEPCCRNRRAAANAWPKHCAAPRGLPQGKCVTASFK